MDLHLFFYQDVPLEKDPNHSLKMVLSLSRTDTLKINWSVCSHIQKKKRISK